MKPFQVILALGLAIGIGMSSEKSAAAPSSCVVAITDSNGVPVAGVVVERFCLALTGATDYEPALEETKVSDNSGRAEFTIRDDKYSTFIAKKTGYALGWSSWQPSSESANTTNPIVLVSPMAFTGVVRDETGKPVSDAVVWIAAAYRSVPRSKGPAWQALDGRLGKKLFTARTALDGTFVMDQLPPDTAFDLAAIKPGLALESVGASHASPQTAQVQPGHTNAELKMLVSGAIQGCVVTEDAGKPVRGASIAIDQVMNGSATPLITREDGTFLIPDLTPGDHNIRARIGTNQFPDWVCEPVIATVDPRKTNSTIKIIANRGGVARIVIREQPSGKPLPDVSISISSSTDHASAKSSAEGIAWLRLTPGDYTLSASKSEYVSERNQLFLEKGATNEVALKLSERPKLTGIVMDPDGKPVPQASVIIFPVRSGWKQTDKEGRFSISYDPEQFSSIPDSQRVLLARDISRNLATAVDLEDGSETNLTVRLQNAISICGKVVDDKGSALTNAEVTLMFWTARMGSSLDQPSRVDQDGKYQIKALPPGRRYGVSALAKGYGRDSRNVDSDSATNRVDLEPLKLELANLSIGGVVVDSDDKPVQGATLWCFGDNQPQISARTDAKGRFLLNQVCAGELRISASTPNGSGHGSIVAQGGDTNVTIQLGISAAIERTSNQASKIKGTVTTPDGKPAARVRISIFPYPSSEKQTDVEGRFTIVSDPNRFGGMQNNEMVLIARDPSGKLAASKDIEEDTTEVALKLLPALTLVGRVTDAAGKPIPSAQAQAMLRTERFSSSVGQPVKADAEGKFTISGLPSGRRYSVTTSARGYGQDSQQADASELTTNIIELEVFSLLTADQRLAGTVLDANDKPVARAWVYAYGDKQPQLNTQTDSKGQFAFDKVCAGKIRISANTSQGGYGNGAAEAGDTNVVINLRSSPGMRSLEPSAQTQKLLGKPLPDLTSVGLKGDECPADQRVLALLIDAEQRPSRRATRVLAEQAESLKQKGIAVLVIQAAATSDEAFAAWKKEAALPFMIGCIKENPEKIRVAAWGAKALPWFILTDKTRKVTAEGFPIENLAEQIGK